MKKLPPEKEPQYREAWKTHTGDQLSQMFGISKRCVTDTNKRLGLQKGLRDNGRPIKQYIRRKDAYPIGTIVTHKLKNGKSIKLIINEQGKRVRLHVHNWLKEGYILFYKDAGREDRDEVDNLVLKTRIQHLLETRNKPILFRIDVKRIEKAKKSLQIQKRKEDAIQKREAKKARIEAARMERERLRAERLAEKQRKEEEREKIRLASEYNKRFKKKEKVMRTRVVDTSNLIPVKIDHKTIVYARSEADIPRIKQIYGKAS